MYIYLLFAKKGGGENTKGGARGVGGEWVSGGGGVSLHVVMSVMVI